MKLCYGCCCILSVFSLSPRLLFSSAPPLLPVFPVVSLLRRLRHGEADGGRGAVQLDELALRDHAANGNRDCAEAGGGSGFQFHYAFGFVGGNGDIGGRDAIRQAEDAQGNGLVVAGLARQLYVQGYVLAPKQRQGRGGRRGRNLEGFAHGVDKQVGRRSKCY